MNQIQFERIYQNYYGRIFAFVKKRVSLVQDAEEIVADVFTSVYKNLERYDKKRSNFDTWLYVITSNRIKNYYRDRKEEWLIDEMKEERFKQEMSVEEIVALQQEREYLLQCLMKLSVRERSIIILKYYQGKNSEEIAKQMSLTSGNVRVILNRSLHKLRKIMQENQGR